MVGEVERPASKERVFLLWDAFFSCLKIERSWERSGRRGGKVGF